MLSLLAVSFVGAQEVPIPLATSTNIVQGIICETYLEILHREPDEVGLQTYTRYMIQEGKDTAWLRKVLSNSKEGRTLRARKRALSTFFGVVLAIGVCGGLLSLAFRKRLRRLFVFYWGKLSPQHQHYLGQAAFLPPLATVLAVLYFFTYFKAGPPAGVILCGLVIIISLIVLRIPRWAFYIVVVCGMLTFVAWAVFVDANGRQDAGCDRDDGVEIAATAVLHGSNPWSHRSILDLPITTGPTSILMALPFVGTLGKINGLTFIMWGSFIALLALADIRQRNNTFFTAFILLCFPWFGFLHTLHWSLDELYYAAVLSPLLWLAFSRDKLILAGVVGAAMAFSRLSYAPAVIATGLWWVLRERPSFRRLIRVVLGGLGYAIAVVGFFWMVGGHEFLNQNFWKNSQMGSVRDSSNLVSSVLSSVLEALPKGTLGSTMLVLAITAFAALVMRRLQHPFYHMAVASVLAHTLAFSPRYSMDYQLIFLIPSLYGLCFSTCESMEGSVRLTQHGDARRDG